MGLPTTRQWRAVPSGAESPSTSDGLNALLDHLVAKVIRPTAA